MQYRNKIIENIVAFFKRKDVKKSKPFVYVAIGDSTVEGIGASAQEKTFTALIFSFLQKKMKTVEYHNFGRTGSRVIDVVEEQLCSAISKNPDLVVISVGANDIRKRTSPKTFEKYFALLLSKLKKETHAVIVINNIPDLSLLTILSRIARVYCKWVVRRFNQGITRHAQKAGAIIIDTHAHSKNLREFGHLVSSDGIHPSDAGYALWADLIIEQIHLLLFQKNQKNAYRFG